MYFDLAESVGGQRLFPAMKTELLLLESLEPRIAPAVLVHGANLLGGPDNPSTGEASLDEDAFTVIKVHGGMALVWFDAVSSSITGISLGNGANIEVFGDVQGDIVTNLTSDGRLSDSDNDPSNGEDGSVLLPSSIAGITIHKTTSEEGNVGNIISGGDISRLSVNGNLAGVYAGTGVFHTDSNVSHGGDFSVDVGFTINPLDPGFGTAYTFTTANHGTALKSGASISNVYISNGVNLQIFAGDGFDNPSGVGGAGGGVTNVTMDSAVIDGIGTYSYQILAGHGGNGLSGGNGGSISGLVEGASSEQVLLQAGNGGAGTAGNGGHGGSIQQINAQSDQSAYTVIAGQGGDGMVHGGNGGNVSQAGFAGRDPKTGIMTAGDFTGNGFEDIVIVDAGSGQMVVMENINGGAEFVPVIQDFGVTDSPFIQPVGVTPVAILSADVDGNGTLDLIVAYANSASVGVYLNDGTGVFTGSAFSAGLSPVGIAAGNFLSATTLDLAILSNTSSGAQLLVAQGDGAGGFTLLSTAVDLGSTRNAVAMVSTTIDGNLLDDLFVGYENGVIKTVLATGSPSSLFQVVSQTTSTNRLSGLDVDPAANQLMAFSAQRKSIVLFTYGGGNLVQQPFAPDISTLPGQALVARLGGPSAGSIQVLTAQADLSRITEFTPGLEGYAQGRVLSTPDPLKTFIPTSGGNSVAALTGSLNSMAYTVGGTEFEKTPLPFDGKSILVTAGDGGDAVNGKGGAGGAINGLNIEATAVMVTTGNGGISLFGAGGNGGGFNNSSSMKLAGGGSVSPALSSELPLTLLLGNGGDGATNGGHGGAISGLTVTIGANTTGVPTVILTGDGGNGGIGKGGHGGNASQLNVTSGGSDFALILGNGGNSDSGKAGGNGGGLSRFTYLQELRSATAQEGEAYEIFVAAGDGGNAPKGKGGAGGALSSVRMNIAPSHIDIENPLDGKDSTTSTILEAGDGGHGAIGGAGGGINNLAFQVTLNQRLVDPNNSGRIFVLQNFAVLEAIAGNGGNGSGGNGGHGGSVANFKAQNVTGYDWDVGGAGPGLFVASGDGGDGATQGGKGGNITKLSAINGRAADLVIKTTWLESAVFVTGSGGDGGTKAGGAGGSLNNVRAAVEAAVFYDPNTDTVFTSGGFLFASAGDGGDSAFFKGGAGGGFNKGSYSTVLVSAENSDPPVESILLESGNGGDGFTQGGAGGGIRGLNLNSPQQGGIYGAILLAGDGGDSTATDNTKSKGGHGGSITSITQPKDLNSFLSLIQAGDGGDSASGTGGNGGSVQGVRTTGFIGRPMDSAGDRLGVLDNGLPQGVFAGLGGTGGTADGDAGSIVNIVARQIAALGGPMLQDGTFAPASSISKVRADLIGFDVNHDGIFQGPLSPMEEVPVDGFLLARVINSIQTHNPVRTEAFTFTS